MNNNKLENFLRTIRCSMTRVQQNAELLAAYLANSKRHRPLLSMVSMEEVRMFASFEETIRCLDYNTNSFKLRLLATRDNEPVFSIVEGSRGIPSNAVPRLGLQISDDMSTCVYVMQKADYSGKVLMWKNLHTSETVKIIDTVHSFNHVVFSKSVNMCVGSIVMRSEAFRKKHFVVHLDNFPNYRFEKVTPKQCLGTEDWILQFMDNDKKMLVCSSSHSIVEYVVIDAMNLFTADACGELKTIRVPKDNSSRALVGSPYGGLLAWYSEISIGLYDIVADEIITLKRFDKHKPEAIIENGKDVGIAFSQRYVAFSFRLSEKNKPYYHVLIVCDTVEKTRYEHDFGWFSIDITSMKFFNDSDYLVFATKERGLMIWDFKRKGSPSRVVTACVDDQIYVKMIPGHGLEKAALARGKFKWKDPDPRYYTSVEVGYSAPF
jgi:WD40 repeat protein